MLLRKELKESDIPSRTTIRNRIEETFQKHLEDLGAEMKVHSQLLLKVYYNILNFL